MMNDETSSIYALNSYSKISEERKKSQKKSKLNRKLFLFYFLYPFHLEDHCNKKEYPISRVIYSEVDMEMGYKCFGRVL